MINIPISRFLEVSVYAIFNLWPYLFLGLAMMRHYLRYSIKITLLLCGLLSILQVGIAICAIILSPKLSGAISLLSTLIYGAFFFWAAKAKIGKTMFVLVILSNLANLVVVSAKCLERILFPQVAHINYDWAAMGTNAFIQIFLIPLYYWFSKKFITPVLKNSENQSWKYLWLIPAIFYITWYYSLYFTTRGSSATIFAMQLESVVFLVVINSGSLLVYYTVAKMLKEHQKNLMLEAENYHLSMQQTRYENLRNRIEEAKKARHDLRQHALAVMAYIESNNYKQLEKYVGSYLCSMPPDTRLSFCSHFTANSVISYYAHIAKERGIDFDCTISIHDEIQLADVDLVVLFGNLFENALDACSTQTEGIRFIRLNGGLQNNRLFAFTLENSHTGEVKKLSSGGFASTKHEGKGTGVISVKSIVERYGGFARFDYDDKMFCASVMMRLPEQV